MNLKDYIANVEDFPIKGIVFRDITPLMLNGEAFSYAASKIAEYAKTKDATVIVGPEARGFIFGCPVATSLKIGFAPVRKAGKLPRETIDVSYELEYGKNVLSLHKDAVKKGDRVVIIDDLLATGGTVRAAIDLVEQLGGIIVGIAFLIELKELNGRKHFPGYDIFTLLEY